MIVGKVLTARGVPVAFANVIILGTRVGAVTDEVGAFVLKGLPPGQIQIRLKAPGSLDYIEALSLTPGDTLRREFRIPPNRYQELQDSLSALGEWPPRVAPDLLEHMRNASMIRVFRLDPDRPVFGAPLDPEHRMGPWPIVGEAHPPSRGVLDKLIDALGASPTRLGVLGEPKKVCGGFSPGIDVRFIRDGVPVDVLLCYRCDEFSLFRDGHYAQSGDFGSQGFVEFAIRTFPRDSVLSRLHTRSGSDTGAH